MQVNEKIIDEHRQAIFVSGNLSDFQLKNLKTWPFVVLNDLQAVKIDYDFLDYDVEEKEDGEIPIGAGKITFDFRFSKKTKISKEKRKVALDHLELWTKFLFWKDTEVIFKRNGRKWR